MNTTNEDTQFTQELSRKGFNIQIQAVAYEFQKGSNQMLKISKQPKQ